MGGGGVGQRRSLLFHARSGGDQVDSKEKKGLRRGPIMNSGRSRHTVGGRQSGRYGSRTACVETARSWRTASWWSAMARKRWISCSVAERLPIDRLIIHPNWCFGLETTEGGWDGSAPAGQEQSADEDNPHRHYDLLEGRAGFGGQLQWERTATFRNQSTSTSSGRQSRPWGCTGWSSISRHRPMGAHNWRRGAEVSVARPEGTVPFAHPAVEPACQAPLLWINGLRLRPQGSPASADLQFVSDYTAEACAMSVRSKANDLSLVSQVPVAIGWCAPSGAKARLLRGAERHG